jgi:hypothetical protein
VLKKIYRREYVERSKSEHDLFIEIFPLILSLLLTFSVKYMYKIETQLFTLKTKASDISTLGN